MFSVRPRPPWPQRKSFLYALSRRLDDSQRRYGRFGEELYLLPVLGLEPLDLPVRSLCGILTSMCYRTERLKNTIGVNNTVSTLRTCNSVTEMCFISCRVYS